MTAITASRVSARRSREPARRRRSPSWRERRRRGGSRPSSAGAGSSTRALRSRRRARTRSPGSACPRVQANPLALAARAYASGRSTRSWPPTRGQTRPVVATASSSGSGRWACYGRAPYAMTHAAPEISVVIPCLNEEEAVGAVVDQALEGIRRSGRSGEVIVVDNALDRPLRRDRRRARRDRRARGAARLRQRVPRGARGRAGRVHRDGRRRRDLPDARTSRRSSSASPPATTS